MDDEGDGLHLLDVIKAENADIGIGVSSLALRHLPHNLPDKRQELHQNCLYCQDYVK